MTIGVGIGIGLSFLAMLCWGFGDFLIQKSTRKVGNWETLFIMSLFGAIVLSPFVAKSLPAILTSSNDALTVLMIASVVLFFAALIDFEGLRVGKLAIVEPIWSFEIPVTAFMAFLIIRERISMIQFILVLLLLIFLVLVAFKEKQLKRKFFLEKGVIIAFLGAIAMGCANFFMGWAGRASDPLMANFFTDTVLVIITGSVLLIGGKLSRLISDARKNISVLLPMSIADKVAWVAFVFSMSLAPMAVATALSESYIIIAVILGIFVNKEKLHTHQKIGLVGAIITAIVLAVITSQ